MNRFDYRRPEGIDAVLRSIDSDALPYAGGTDLLTRLKLGLERPATLIDLKAAGLPDTIDGDGGGLQLGALVTLADLERARLPEWAGALGDAAAQAASPQIRERATVAGNLLQRPRCWYYRDPEVDCWLKGGDGCPARDGRNEHHALLPSTHPASSPCAAVHPSDLAASLAALGAEVTVRTRAGDAQRSLDELLRAPVDGRRREHTLADDELLLSIRVPAPPAGTRSLYLKAMDRKVWAFALVGLAARARIEDGRLADLALVASGIGNVPVRFDELSDALSGRSTTADDVEDAARAAIEATVAELEPLSDNGYKRDLLARLIRSALRELVTAPSTV